MRKELMHKSLSVLAGITLGVAVVVAGCSISTGEEAAQAPVEKLARQAVAAQVDDTVKAGSNRTTPIVKAAAKVGPAVVGITNKAYVRDFFNRVQLTERGTGSGVIYDSAKGLIATNNHVVAGAQEIIVSLSDGKTYKGTVLGADAATDLAVVKIDAKKLPQAELGNSDDIMVGETAIAIGNPLGLEFRGSVTVGVISALNRSIDLGERKFKLLQTDAAINPGNSGGALVNVDGQVIGINSAKIAVSGVEGIGFAIPVNDAKVVLAELEKNGRVIRPYLGVSLIDQDVANKYGMQTDLKGGVLVMRLYQGGPAWRAGIRQNDIITKFNGKKVENVSQLRNLIAASKVGEVVKVTVIRNGHKMDLNVTLHEMPQY